MLWRIPSANISQLFIKPTFNIEQRFLNISRAIRQFSSHPLSSSKGLDPDKNSETFFLVVLLYLFVPAMAILLFFGPWPVAVAAAVGLAVLWLLAPIRDGGLRFPTSHFAHTWPYLIMAAMVVWFAGVLPPFTHNSDWYKHYAMFNALADQSWPPIIATRDGLATLRYSLAYYAIPALIAKLFGAWALSAAIFIWTTLGLYLAMVLAFGSTARPATALLLGSVFLLFSGADIIGSWYTHLYLGPVLHFEWWAGFGVLASTITNLFWVPQHALAGFISAFLVFRYPRCSVKNAGLIGATVSLWSPFAAIGLAPIFLWAVFKTGFSPLFSKSNFIAAPILLLCAAKFLSTGSSGIPWQFVWDIPGISLKTWLFFIFLEIGAITVSLIIATRNNTALILLTATFLVILSLFKFGGANDLLMRASIPSLGILAVLTARAIVQERNTFTKAPLFICILAGLATPLGEIARAPLAYRIKNIHDITINNIIDTNKSLEPQYLVYIDTDKFKSEKIMDLANFEFSTMGSAKFDSALLKIESDQYVDAAFVTNRISLPPGLYRLDAVVDLDVTAEKPGTNAAHISLHGKELLIPITDTTTNGKRVTRYFRVNNKKPFQLSIGLGGWSTGKGVLELKDLTISSVTAL